MKTLTQRAIETATERREEAWQRWCKATSEGAKKHWSKTLDKYTELVKRLEGRAGR